MFEMKNPGELPLPKVLVYFMVAIFGLPALMVIATTIKEVPKYPWLILVYIASMFPLIVMYAIKRVMGRYAVRVHEDGSIEIVYPFKTVRIAKEQLASVAMQSTYIASANTRRTSIVLGSREGKVLAAFSPSAFAANEVSQFFDALRSVNPDVVIQQ